MKITSHRKILVLTVGAFAIFFTGYPHIWSIYQPYAIALTGWSQGQASMCFYLTFVTFVLGNIVGGRIQDRHGPRWVIVTGGGIFTASIFLSSIALRSSPWMMYATFGLMQGFGQGMIYTTIISTAQKWFPEKTGFASGVVVTANGLFGFIMSPFSKMLLEGPGIHATFLVIGCMIAVSWILSSLIVCNPATTSNQKTETVWAGKQYTASEMVKTRKFYPLVATMLFGLIPYLLLSPVSQTVQLERGVPAGIAVSSVMLGSVCNGAARLFLPTIADRLGRIPCLKVVLVVAVVAMLLLVAAPVSVTTLCVVLMYTCYGGIMGSFPSLSSSLFGMKYSGENYGYVMTGIVAATLSAPVITSFILGLGFDRNAVFAFGAGCAAMALLCLRLLEKELQSERR